MVDHNGTPGNDTIVGGALNDVMMGLGGNDVLFGLATEDILDGGAGNDSLDGGAENDVLKGGAGNDTLIGGTGADEMIGGAGNDIYEVDHADDIVTELAAGGTDRIRTQLDNASLADYGHVEILQLLGSANLKASGSDRPDTLTGNIGNNVLSGGKGNDTLSGVLGVDTLEGGLNDDTYFVDASNDVVNEAVGGGKDTILASGNYALAAGQEIEILKLDSGALATAITATGNEFANIIIGNDANNTLDGGKGNDTLTGGKGNDIYVVDSVADKITELANQGTSDSVFSFLANYTLGANVENLFLVTGAVNGTGNTLNNNMDGNGLGNTLDGGGGHDVLSGSGGADSLIGGAGNDTLEGGSGIDTMKGGTGNDTYVVNELTDDVVEVAGGGVDLVKTTVDGLVLAANVENLTLQGAAVHGAGNTLGNYITGNGIGNSLAGHDGNDTLDGAGGADNLSGGKGNDTYFVDDLNDQVNEAIGEGKDTVFASTTYQIASDAEIEILTLAGDGDFGLTGNKFANTINGNAGDNGLNGQFANDTLNGGDGNDHLDGGTGDDVMNGGKGDDTFYVDSTKDKANEAAGQGKDRVYVNVASYTLGANIEEGFLLGSGSKLVGNTLGNLLNGNSGNNTLDGGSGNDTLGGGSGDDSLVGGAGNDALDGGFGDDTMVGGVGNDVYIVDSLADVVTEAAGQGIDLVKASIGGVMLATNVENLTLVSGVSGEGNDLGNVITGNSGINVLGGGKGNDSLYGAAGNDDLHGDDGNDTLDGGADNDSMSGGKGNDTYYVDHLDDTVSESPGGGKDTVFASIGYSLEAEVEVLTLTGTGDIQGNGNLLANLINGNSGDNSLGGWTGDDTLNGAQGNDSLFGLADNDVLNGGDGDDNLDGGSGKDTMAGGKGDDTYFVTEAGDKLTEAAGQGNDRVFVGIASYILGANVEQAWLLGGGGNVVGNTLGNVFNGNGLGNKLDGAGGNDQIDGNLGNDTLLGGAGNDSLDGGAGDDSLVGGAGNDVYENVDSSDNISELAGGGTDTVETTISGLILAANVENLTLLGSADISGIGNGLSNLMTGNDGKNFLVGDKGNDTLNGGAGGDALVGGAGNDTYYIDDANDIILEGAGQGKDTVHSSVTFNFNDSLEIETAILSSASAIASLGNNFANTITMTGTGQATLNGNDGNDTLTGAGGNDLLIGGNGNDVINGAGGNDNILGDDNNDKLTGGEGDDTLNGGSGKDTMVGGKGSDTYFVAEVGDTVTELVGQGDDTVHSQLVSYTLTANVEVLALGAGALNGTGNASDNRMFGNGADNKLDGGGGADLLFGADGNDSLVGGLGFDYLSGGSGNDTLKGGGDIDYLEGGAGADVMYGEAGKDGFLYRIATDAELATLGGDTINGFQTGVDRIELSDLLNQFGVSAANAFSGGFVLLTKDGSNTLVQFDENGFGGTGPVTLATVVNANVATTDVMLDSMFIL